LRVIISSLREGREMRKAISGIMLTLMLIDTLTLVFNVYAGVMPLLVLWEREEPLAISPMDVKIADVGGDGFKDVVVGVGKYPKSSILAFDGLGNLLWNFSDIEETVVTLDVNDIDGDGLDDIVIYASGGWSRGPGGWGSEDTYLYVVDNGGMLIWKRFLSHFSSGSGQRIFSIGDINGDGKNEIIVDTFMKITAFNCLGDEIWSYYMDSTIGNIKVDDVDNDGIKDVVATYWAGTNGGIIALNGTGEIIWQYPTKAGMKALAIGDVNADGRKEVVASNYDSPEDAENGIYLLDGLGSLIWYSRAGSYANSIKIWDVNNDGINEIIAGTDRGEIYVINAYGDVLWSYSIKATPISDITIGDFDADKTVDIAICGAYYSHNPERSDGVWIFNGSGSIKWEFRGKNNFMSLSAGDINADGVDDIITCTLDIEHIGGRIYVLSSKIQIKIISSTIDVSPQTLNLRSKGEWITAYLELPEGYDVAYINRTTILLNGTIPVDSFWTSKPIKSVIGDYDNDTIPDLMVKFDRQQVINYIMSNVDLERLYEERFMTITLTITGKLNDGTPFQGSDTIKIILPMPRYWRLLAKLEIYPF
jgi:hypothetical protein